MTELENISDFDAFFKRNSRLAATRTNSAVIRFGNFDVFDFTYVPFDIHTRIVVICLVCPANEVVYIQKRLVVHDFSLTFEADGAYKPGDNVAVFGYTDRRMNFFFQIVPEFCFVYFQVASDKYNDVFVVIVNLIYDRFAHFSLFDAEFTR